MIYDIFSAKGGQVFGCEHRSNMVKDQEKHLMKKLSKKNVKNRSSIGKEETLLR